LRKEHGEEFGRSSISKDDAIDVDIEKEEDKKRSSSKKPKLAEPPPKRKSSAKKDK